MESRKLNQILVLLSYFLVFSCSSKLLPAQEDVTNSLIESASHSDPNSVLSVRTERIDPLDNFRKYTGGYNISNKHYWSSTIYTGKYGYIISALWILCGVSLVAICVISRTYFSEKEKTQRIRTSCSQKIDLWFILLTILFVTLIIIASSIALTGSVRFHARAESIKRIISRTASGASETLFNVSKAIESMQNIKYIYEGLENSTDLNSTAQILSEEASDIQRKAEESMRLVNSGINILEIVTIITVVVNLVAVLALLVARPLKFNPIFSWTIILCWTCTSFLWMYFGIYFFLAEFSNDTCIALDEYQLNSENSSLGSILPCSGKANKILQDVGISIHDLINQVNGKIFTIRSSEIAELQFVCNPFSGPPNYLYQPDNCLKEICMLRD
ncbi:hypothetical protein LUZ60_007606 [Juncus effusus]|nr:hypothetical protein LUZ60_007606 [Juncus effusus]